MDDLVVRFTSREWALCAISDLAAEGCFGQLLEGRSECGCWRVRVSGPAEKIAQVRYAAEGPATRVDWEAFVNLALSGGA